MRQLATTKRFERDLKRMRKRGKDLDKLFHVVEKLRLGEELEPRHRPHTLTGNWKPFWELHVEPDWLLVYEPTDEVLYLVRTGTHADLF
ncbi:MAG: type II toxin-antitoxin system YafQ family toxin [Deinococcota bacterium]|nr:type II toxin-antitoxin system YafQ family toxin [Deinococcota bacterium]